MRPLVRVVGDFTAGPPNTPGLNSVGLNTAPVLIEQMSVQRGRQYELDHCEAGTLTLTVSDPSEYLSPANTSSPWNSGGNSLLPYRCIGVSALWNAATLSTAGNILNAGNTIPGGTTAYDPGFESGTSGWITNDNSTVAQTTAQAYQGTHSLACTLNASTSVAGCYVALIPGQRFTFSAWVYAATGVTVALAATGAPTVSATGTGAWQRLTTTSSAQTAAIGAITVGATAAGSYPATVYVDAVQIEIGTTASTFGTTGPTYYPIFTGYIERYPHTWDSAGFRGVKQLEAVDALSPLSRAVISQSYRATILADSPTVYIPYSDQSAPTSVQLPSGGQPMLGYTALGTNGSVNYSGDTFPDGTPAVTVVQQNTSPPINGNTAYDTWAGTLFGSIAMNPQAATLETWVKISGGTPYFGAAQVQTTDNLGTDPYGPAYYFGWYTGSGTLLLHYTDPNGGSVGFNIGGGTFQGYPDGQWHYLALVLSADTVRSIVDSYVGGAPSLGFTPSTAVLLNNFFVESTTYSGDPVTDIAVANLAFYPAALSTTRLAAHYQRGAGYIGELSGNRAYRLLSQYWSTNVVYAAGIMPMSPDYDYNGQTVLQMLQDISDTEEGLVWCDAAGVVHFDSRDTRYLNSPTSLYTFGENTAGGELPYVDLEYDYDPTYLYSQTNLSRPGGSATLTTVNSTSLAAYGQRILSKTLYTTDDWRLGQAAAFYLARYAVPKLRVSALTLDPASNPALWAAVLALDIGKRVTARRRTSAGVTIAGDYYLEQVSHTINGDDGTWDAGYQMSPVWNTQAWVLGNSTSGVLGSTTTVIY